MNPIERYNQINTFLDYITKLAKQNPDFPINSNSIYSNLIYMNCEPSTEKEIAYYFPHWIERFKNTPNINVHNDQNWSYFCQFDNCKSKEEIINTEQIKIYVPLDRNHIYNGSNQLFDYLASNNIKHVSKIGKDFRFDSVVVRVFNIEDAKKVENFINQNNYIKEGLYKPNPFFANDKNVALASDGLLSSNTVLSSLISLYVNEYKNQNIEFQNHYQTFYNYIEQLYNFYYKNENSNIEDLFNTIHPGKDKSNIAASMANTKNVIEMIMESGKLNANENTLYQHFAKISQPNYRKEQENAIKRKINPSENINQTTNLNSEYNTLINIVDTTIYKYGIKQGIKAIREYVENGNPSYFTNDNQARTTLIKMFTPDQVKSIIINSIGAYDPYKFMIDSKTRPR